MKSTRAKSVARASRKFRTCPVPWVSRYFQVAVPVEPGGRERDRDRLLDHLGDRRLDDAPVRCGRGRGQGLLALRPVGRAGGALLHRRAPQLVHALLELPGPLSGAGNQRRAEHDPREAAAQPDEQDQGEPFHLSSADEWARSATPGFSTNRSALCSAKYLGRKKASAIVD